ncbi:MAG: LytTR family DNA-binding domain-containing protein [Cyclobacteriaceae bacterium]|nr:response regulator transcription factor [Cyclobacteriaceae bacterium]
MIRCLIIEDEPLAAEVLKDYIQQVPFLTLVDTCSDALFALEVLKKEQIDLMFLDIHLPGLKGVDMLSSLANPPQVILTTAYNEYALQGYELNVVDYLLKPIEFKRFYQAVSKVKVGDVSAAKATITIQADSKKLVINTADILFIESQKEYIFIKTKTGDYKTKYAISRIEDELNPQMFLRVHRSFIVSMHHITAFNATSVNLPGKAVPIGGNFKESVIRTLSTKL